MQGTGIFFDGRSSARHAVDLRLGPGALVITGAAGQPIAEWPYAELIELDTPGPGLRLARRGNPVTERLEVPDAALAAAIDDHAEEVDRSGHLRRRQRTSVVVWSVTATASLLLAAWFGVPAIAERLAPHMPPAIERRLGEAVDMQTRAMLDTQGAGDGFTCGTAPAERAGRAALDKIVKRLEVAAALNVTLRPEVVRNEAANALALPGGHIYVLQGLIAKAQSADEVAGVIAHEIGHIAHRDGTKGVLQAGGLSLLFGMLLGDFVGGGAVVMAARTVLQSSYTREAETAADAYAAMLMAKAGGDVTALATMLGRLGGATEPGMKILLDHPETEARIAAINRLATRGPTTPFLSPAEWAALKRICAR